MLIHLGDVEGGEEYIDTVVDCEKHIVRGNNDFFSDLPREEEFYIGKYKIFITHGHSYYVSLDPEYIREEGKARKADIVMFGHTDLFSKRWTRLTRVSEGVFLSRGRRAERAVI